MLKPYDVELAAEQLPSIPVLMSKKTIPPRKPKVKKLFVLDTNVLMHDPTSLFRFEEHDVYLPIADARGARRPQERHVRRVAQRAPGDRAPSTSS